MREREGEVLRESVIYDTLCHQGRVPHRIWAPQKYRRPCRNPVTVLSLNGFPNQMVVMLGPVEPTTRNVHAYKSSRTSCDCRALRGNDSKRALQEEHEPTIAQRRESHEARWRVLCCVTLEQGSYCARVDIEILQLDTSWNRMRSCLWSYASSCERFLSY